MSAADDKLLSLLREAREEAYRRGWDDAVKSIAAAKGAAPVRENPPAADVMADDAPRTVYGAMRASGGATGRAAPARAPWGLSIRATKTAMERAGDQGIEWQVVREIGKELAGFEMAESSIRSTLWEMTKRGELVRRGDRYFPSGKAAKG